MLRFGSSQQSRRLTDKQNWGSQFYSNILFDSHQFILTFKLSLTHYLAVPTRLQLLTHWWHRTCWILLAKVPPPPPRLPKATSSSAVHSQLKGCTSKKLRLKSQIIKAVTVLLHWIHWCRYWWIWPQELQQADRFCPVGTMHYSLFL